MLDKSLTKCYSIIRKGAPEKGLRGGCTASTLPDLDNANVGMRKKPFPRAERGCGRIFRDIPQGDVLFS